MRKLVCPGCNGCGCLSQTGAYSAQARRHSCIDRRRASHHFRRRVAQDLAEASARDAAGMKEGETGWTTSATPAS
jgi:hypothetical protein